MEEGFLFKKKLLKVLINSIVFSLMIYITKLVWGLTVHLLYSDQFLDIQG